MPLQYFSRGNKRDWGLGMADTAIHLYMLSTVLYELSHLNALPLAYIKMASLAKATYNSMLPYIHTHTYTTHTDIWDNFSMHHI